MPTPRLTTSIKRQAARPAKPPGTARPSIGQYVSAVVSQLGGDNSGIVYVIVNGSEMSVRSVVVGSPLSVGQLVWVTWTGTEALLVGLQ